MDFNKIYFVHNGILPKENRKYLMETDPPKWGTKREGLLFSYGDAQKQLKKARRVWLSPGIERIDE